MSLTADDGPLVQRAIRLATTKDAEGESREPAERRADAFVNIAKFFSDHHDQPMSKRHRMHVSITASIDDLAHGGPGAYEDGSVASPEAVQVTACDSVWHRILTDGGSKILEYGTVNGDPSPAQWAALVARDRHCRHPGCDAPAIHCDAHHVVPRPHGETNLSNLVLKCRRHHRLAHKRRWREHLDEQGVLTITTDGGGRWVTHPPGFIAPRLPIPA